MFEQILSFWASLRGFIVIVLFFGGSIFVHELGHFLAAKWRGLKVDKFSIGFGPRIFGWKGKDGVDYRISLLPLGGYVSIPELAEMEMIEGKSETKISAPKKISYISKVIVFAAGAFFNVLFALILALILWALGSISSDWIDSNVIGNVEKNIEIEPGKNVVSPAFEAGLKPGDKIISVDGEATPTFDKILIALALGTKRDSSGNATSLLEIERNGHVEKNSVFPKLVQQNPQSGDFIRMIGISPISTLKITPQKNLPAFEAGARFGDVWTAIRTKKIGGNDDEKIEQKLFSIPQLSKILEENGTEKVEIIYERNGVTGTLEVAPKVVSTTVEIATLEFFEGEKKRTIQLVAAPENLENTSPKAKRETLRILFSLPSDSEFAGTLPSGTIIDGISFENGTIQAPKTPEEFAKAFAEAPSGTFSLFVTKPNGSEANVILKNASAGTIESKSAPLLGIALIQEEKLVHKTPWQQFSGSISLTFKSLFGLLNPKSDIKISHLNGVLSIGDAYFEMSSSLRRIFSLTILININLAILNLLPIPVLDGGHILIATIRKIRRKPVPEKLINSVQTVFMVLFLLLMGYVLMKDFSRFMGSREIAAESQMIRFAYTPEYLELSKIPAVTNSANEEIAGTTAAGTSIEADAGTTTSE